MTDKISCLNPLTT